MTEVINLPIGSIRIDGGTQIRTLIYDDRIKEYALAMTDGQHFPPLVVFWDGECYWLADGFHRRAAMNGIRISLGLDTINVPCEIREGTLRDAILHACGANAAHGIPRTDDDKRNAVDTVLKNPLVAHRPDGTPWAAAEIARICNVSDFLVRKRLATVVCSSARTCVSNVRNGKVYTQVTRKRAAAEPKPENSAQPGPAQQSTFGPAAAPDQSEATAATAAAVRPPPAEPPRDTGTVVSYKTKWDYLHAEVRKIDEAIKALPAPDVVVANYPLGLTYTLPMSRAREIQRYVNEFVRLWEARAPEFASFHQRQQDFIRDEMAARVRAAEETARAETY
jgi:hypothetical protein